MADAIRIEQRLAGLFSGRRDRVHPKQPDAESPREIERRARERLYGERSSAVVRTHPEDSDKQA